MGKWLKGLLHQEIANDVEMVLGLDESWASIYGFFVLPETWILTG